MSGFRGPFSQSDLEHPGVLWNVTPLAVIAKWLERHSVNHELNCWAPPLLAQSDRTSSR